MVHRWLIPEKIQDILYQSQGGECKPEWECGCEPEHRKSKSHHRLFHLEMHDTELQAPVKEEQCKAQKKYL